jgi:hypothetical protein
MSRGSSPLVAILGGLLFVSVQIVETMFLVGLPVHAIAPVSSVWWIPLMGPVFPAAALPTLLFEPNGGLSLKALVTLGVVRQLAQLDPRRAFDLSETVEVTHSRALGFETALVQWSQKDAPAALKRARDRAVVEAKERAAGTLCGLARGVAPVDPELARELTQKSVSLLPSSDVGREETLYCYQAVSVLDPAGIATELARLVREDDQAGLLALAAGIREAQPEQAWRALQAATVPRDSNKNRLMQLAGISRELAGRLPAMYRAELIGYNTELFDRAAEYDQPLVSFSGPSPFGVVALMDAMAALATVDPKLAWARVEKLRLPSNVTRMILQRTRVGSVERFPNDLLRLELALSELATAPKNALVVFESLDQAFWEAAATVAFRWSGLTAPFVENAGPARIVDQLRRVRSDWPRVARRLCATDPVTCQRMLRRFRQVAEWLDLAAIDRIANEQAYRSVWAAYLPLTLTVAAEAMVGSDIEDADEAVRRGLELTLKLPSPSREWALAWNAVAWKRLNTDEAASATKQAAEHLRRLTARAGGRDWWQWMPRLLEQVASIDLEHAYSLARLSHPAIRGAALIAVASAMSPATSPVRAEP